jgi:hypothetical protein
MSSLKEMRESIDIKLDGWEQTAIAIEKQLQSTREQALKRVELQKKKMSSAAARFKQAIPRIGQISDQVQQEIGQKIDTLQLQLALGQAETRDSYQAQKTKILRGIAEIDARIGDVDDVLEWELDAAVKEWIHEGLALDAELEVAQIHYDEPFTEGCADLNEEKNEIVERVRSYRDLIAAKRKLASEHLGTFEADLLTGVNQIKESITKLVSR